MENDSLTRSGGGGVECWTQRTFSKIIIILIDALRFDFANYYNEQQQQQQQQEEEGSKFFRNHLPFLYHLLQTQRTHSLLYKFVADPPTTTMQRLKALTTGNFN
jgi:phosphatidylinositol glycan class O